MKIYINFYTLVPVAILLASCANSGPLVMLYDTTEAPGKVKPSEYNRKHVDASVPLGMSPELHGKAEVPGADHIAVQAEQPAYIINKIVEIGAAGAGSKAVSLDVRDYHVSAAALFSALLDAMTALNLPIEDVNSPSGTLITGWIRADAAQTNFPAQEPTRYRYVVRVFRSDHDQHARLEVQTVGQAFISKKWIARKMSRKVSNELFYLVKEQLTNPMSSDDELPAE